MKSISEIEELAKQSWEGCDGCDDHGEYFFVKGFSSGYRQNQDKKYTEEDIREAVDMARMLSHITCDSIDQSHRIKYSNTEDDIIKLLSKD